MFDPIQLRLEVRRLVARWIVMYPEDADLPSDLMRRMAARHVVARLRRDATTLSPEYQQVEPPLRMQ